MAVNVSTGFAAAILGPTSFDNLFKDGVIEVRTGVQPVNADAAPTGIVIGYITKDGGAFSHGVPTNGLRFGRSARYAFKDPAQTWRLKGVATGVAGWFRLLRNAPDGGADSGTAPRIDGAVGLTGVVADTQLFLDTLSITPSTNVEIPSWWFAIPPI